VETLRFLSSTHIQDIYHIISINYMVEKGRNNIAYNDGELCEVTNQFLKTKKKSTAKVYKNRLRIFSAYYKKSIKEFIQEIEQQQELNKNRSITDRKRVAENTIRAFVEWMQEHGLSPNTIKSCVVAIQSLLKYYQIPFSTRWIELPSTQSLQENKKHKWKLEEIKQFVDCAEYIRDKAIITCLFQSGLSISDLIALNIRHVRKQLEQNDLPILLDVTRKKTNVNFKTSLGADAAHYLKEYLQKRPNIKDHSALFTMLGSEERVTSGTIQYKFRDYAEKTGLFSDFDLEGWNPARPHSFRSAFKSRLTNKVDRDLIEFMMGHSVARVPRFFYGFPALICSPSIFVLSLCTFITKFFKKPILVYASLQ
jgi:integrase/recombinase XerD